MGGAVAGIREGVPPHQQRFQNHQLQTINGLGALVGDGLHIHRHLRGGVKGVQDQLRAQQFHPCHGFHQLTVFEGEALRGPQTEGGPTGLLDRDGFRKVSLIGDEVFLHRPEQQRPALGGVHGFDEDHCLGGDARGDLLSRIDHQAVLIAAEHFAVREQVQGAGADNDLPQNVVLLGDGDDARGLAEDVFDDLRTGFDPLTVFNHQQGDVLVDFVGLLRNPQQRAAFADLKAVLGGAGFLDGKAGGELDHAPSFGAEAIISQFGNHLTRTDLAAGGGAQ